jgi:hypothetical protein
LPRRTARQAAKEPFLEVAWLATVIKLWSLLRRLPHHSVQRTKSLNVAEFPTPRFSRPQSVLTELKEVTHQIVKDRFSPACWKPSPSHQPRTQTSHRGRSLRFAASPPLSRKALRPSMGLVEFFCSAFVTALVRPPAVLVRPSPIRIYRRAPLVGRPPTWARSRYRVCPACGRERNLNLRLGPVNDSKRN